MGGGGGGPARGQPLREQLAAGQPGAEGSAAKFAYARLNQEISGFELELLGEDGLRYDDWTMRRPSIVDALQRTPGYRYLRAKGNSIEGGTSEILSNIIAERVLGLPAEPAYRQGRRLEGPAPVTSLLYSEVEEDLRAAVRQAVTRAAAPSTAGSVTPGSAAPGSAAPGSAAPGSAAPGSVTPGSAVGSADLWRTLSVEIGCAGLAVPEDRGGAGGSWREVAVVAEELGRGVAALPPAGAPGGTAVPFLGSTLATAALLAIDPGDVPAPKVPTSGSPASDSPASDILTKVASGGLIAVLVLPLSTPPGASLTDAVRRGGRAADGQGLWRRRRRRGGPAAGTDQGRPVRGRGRAGRAGTGDRARPDATVVRHRCCTVRPRRSWPEPTPSGERGRRR